MRNIDSGRVIRILAKIGAIATIVSSPPCIAQEWTTESTCPDNAPMAFHSCALEAVETFEPPRTPDGWPDMEGIWVLPEVYSYEDLEEHPRQLDDRGGPAGIVDPPDGTVPMHAWADARRRGHTRRYVHPSAACFLPGVPHSAYFGGVHQILQTPDYLVILGTRTHEYRIIPLVERPPLGESIRLWNGDSRGRWEGNTLVIETTNLNGLTWLDQRGRFFTEEARVVERLTLVDVDTLHHQATLYDPNVYTRPFTIASPYRRSSEEEFEIEMDDSVACYENNQTLLEVYRDLGFEYYPGISAAEAREAIEADQ